MSETPMRGAEYLPALLGRRIVGLRRWVFDLGNANDEFGHGVTLLSLDDGSCLSLRPGPMEEYIVLQAGEPDLEGLPSQYWTPVDLVERNLWQPRPGPVSHIEFFTDGVDDVAVRLHFQDGGAVVFALIDTDLVLTDSLAVFDSDPAVSPTLRQTIG